VSEEELWRNLQQQKPGTENLQEFCDNRFLPLAKLASEEL
jgi:hypothetical protein